MVKDDSDLEDLDDSSEDSQVEHDNNSEQADQDDTDEIKDIQDAFVVCLLTESKIILKAYGLIKHKNIFIVFRITMKEKLSVRTNLTCPNVS